MNNMLKIFLSLSFSGSLLILLLFFCRHFLKNRMSRQWQYYIWLVVIARLLLPFTLETTLMGNVFQTIDYVIFHSNSVWFLQSEKSHIKDIDFVAIDSTETSNQEIIEQTTMSPNKQSIWDMITLLSNNVWLVWLVVALILLIRKITIYQNFVWYVKAGQIPVTDTELLDKIAIIGEQVGVKKAIELCVNPLISSPLLIGFFQPRIVLPSTDISEKDFQYIMLHELTHYRRQDMFYKWLVQVTICLHWFNPIVYLMGCEINKACEFSCDEAIISKLDFINIQEYGKTLLDAMKAAGKYKESVVSVTLNENKELLKERLGAIMNFRKKSNMVTITTFVFTLFLCICATTIGAYAATNNDNKSSVILKGIDKTNKEKIANIGDMKFYLIDNEKDLRAIGSSKYPLYGNYMLNSDITLTKEWIPIGVDEDSPFSGYFEGNGFTISNIFVDDEEGKYRYVGFFGLIEEGKVHNLTLKNISLRTTRPANDVIVHYIAAVSAYSEISDCSVKNYSMEKLYNGEIRKWSGQLLESKSNKKSK